MDETRPTLSYQRRGKRQTLLSSFLVFGVICLIAACIVAGTAYIRQQRDVRLTPQYEKYIQTVQLQAATQPAGTYVRPPFTGKPYSRYSIFEFAGVYIAGALAIAGLCLVVFGWRRSGTAELLPNDE